MTVSIGATLIKETDDIHSLFDRADKALYQAKSTGRNKLCYVQK
jgi:PleD family two-component response regulator